MIKVSQIFKAALLNKKYYSMLSWDENTQCFGGLRSVLSAKMTIWQCPTMIPFCNYFSLGTGSFPITLHKTSRETFFTLEFKTNTFSIPIHKWVHFYFSKHYFMAVRKQKYQTEEHIEYVTMVAIWIRCVPWFNVKLFVVLLGNSAKLCIYTI